MRSAYSRRVLSYRKFMNSITSQQHGLSYKIKKARSLSPSCTPSQVPYLSTTALRTKSTGIIVTASNATAAQPIMPNGTQLNIFPIQVKAVNGTKAAFTINACTRIMVKNTFKNPGFSFKPLKMPNLSSLTLNPLNNALTINSTK